MGTRNLTIVINDGQTKVAQYGQWDGYPSGQGKTVLEFLKRADIDTFKTRLLGCKFITAAAVEKYYNKLGAKGDFVTLDVSEQFKQLYPLLHRDIGANVLNGIYDGEISWEESKLNGEDWVRVKTTVPIKKKELVNDESFMRDGLFCEWAYEINLDECVLNVYRNGKNKIKTYQLNQLPEVDAFIAELDAVPQVENY